MGRNPAVGRQGPAHHLSQHRRRRPSADPAGPAGRHRHGRGVVGLRVGRRVGRGQLRARFQVQRLQLADPADPLLQLPQVGTTQDFSQLRLPRHDNLQQLLTRRLQVQQQPNQDDQSTREAKPREEQGTDQSKQGDQSTQTGGTQTGNR